MSNARVNAGLKNEKNDLNNHLHRYYQLENTPLKKLLTFNISLSYTEWQTKACGWNPWDEIIPHLYLGKIPTANEALQLKKTIPNLKLVVTLLEPFEASGIGFPFNLEIQSSSQWKKLDVEHHQLIVPDFTADVPISELIEILRKMHSNIKANQDVYVHCKAGKGRSATLLFLYLYFYGSNDGQLSSRKTFDTIYAFLKAKRPQVKLNEQNFEKIREVVTFISQHEYCAMLDDVDNKTEINRCSFKNENKTLFQIKDDLDHYLASIEAKQMICQLNSFKDLISYGARKQHFFSNSNRAIQIQTFLDHIYYAEDADWYFDLLNEKGPLKNLLDARPRGLFGSGEAVERKIIVDALKAELTKGFADKLDCKEETLKILANNPPPNLIF